MVIIDSVNDLIENCHYLDECLSKETYSDDYIFARNLIQKGNVFFIIIKEGKYRFYPSRFIGYKYNDHIKHRQNHGKDGTLTNNAIDKMFKRIYREGGNNLKHYKLDSEYIKFCASLYECTPKKFNNNPKIPNHGRSYWLPY